jgi:hypothetical protein
MVPTYTEEQILNAIKKEGLLPHAWGYKTKGCIFVFEDAMEKNEVWDELPTPVRGFEQAAHDHNVLEPVRYFIIGKFNNGLYEGSYSGDIHDLGPDEDENTVPEIMRTDSGIWVSKSYLDQRLKELQYSHRTSLPATMQSEYYLCKIDMLREFMKALEENK